MSSGRSCGGMRLVGRCRNSEAKLSVPASRMNCDLVQPIQRPLEASLLPPLSKAFQLPQRLSILPHPSRA